jgi:hypothetical protein
VWDLHELVNGELLECQIDIDPINAVPIVETLTVSVRKENLGFQKLPAEQVAHDQRGGSTLPSAGIVSCPLVHIDRVATVDRPAGTQGSFERIESDM